jgi:hypothetical protein
MHKWVTPDGPREGIGSRHWECRILSPSGAGGFELWYASEPSRGRVTVT